MVRLQKTLILLIDFYKFVQLQGQLGAALGALVGNFELILNLRVALGHLGDILVSLWPKRANVSIQFAKNIHFYNEF